MMYSPCTPHTNNLNKLAASSIENNIFSFLKIQTLLRISFADSNKNAIDFVQLEKQRKIKDKN